MGVYFRRGPFFRRDMDGLFFLGFLLLEKFLLGFFPLQMCNMPRNRVSLLRGHAGEPGGGSFAGTFERKAIVYSK